MSRTIGALWLKETKDGKKYFSGVLNDLSGDIRIAIFKNDRKEKENQPDYQIILSEERKDKPQQGTQYSGQQAAASSGDEIDVSQIPF